MSVPPLADLLSNDDPVPLAQQPAFAPAVTAITAALPTSLPYNATLAVLRKAQKKRRSDRDLAEAALIAQCFKTLDRALPCARMPGMPIFVAC